MDAYFHAQAELRRIRDDLLIAAGQRPPDDIGAAPLMLLATILSSVLHAVSNTERLLSLVLAMARWNENVALQVEIEFEEGEDE